VLLRKWIDGAGEIGIGLSRRNTKLLRGTPYGSLDLEIKWNGYGGSGSTDVQGVLI